MAGAGAEGTVQVLTRGQHRSKWYRGRAFVAIARKSRPPMQARVVSADDLRGLDVIAESLMSGATAASGFLLGCFRVSMTSNAPPAIHQLFSHRARDVPGPAPASPSLWLRQSANRVCRSF